MAYQCDLCKETFEEDWSDEEALAEMNQNFPGIRVEECNVVCDDCYLMLRISNSPELVKEAIAEHISERKE